jgi:hypothetical protein
VAVVLPEKLGHLEANYALFGRFSGDAAPRAIPFDIAGSGIMVDPPNEDPQMATLDPLKRNQLSEATVPADFRPENFVFRIERAE